MIVPPIFLIFISHFDLICRPRAQFDAVLNALVMQTSLLASQVTRRGIRIVAYIVLLAHVFACFWFYLGWARVSEVAGTAWGEGSWMEGLHEGVGLRGR